MTNYDSHLPCASLLFSPRYQGCRLPPVLPIVSTLVLTCLACDRDGTKLIGPADVATSLKLLNKTVFAGTTVLANGQSTTVESFDIHAVRFAEWRRSRSFYLKRVSSLLKFQARHAFGLHCCFYKHVFLHLEPLCTCVHARGLRACGRSPLPPHTPVCRATVCRA